MVTRKAVVVTRSSRSYLATFLPSRLIGTRVARVPELIANYAVADFERSTTNLWRGALVPAIKVRPVKLSSDPPLTTRGSIPLRIAKGGVGTLVEILPSCRHVS